MVGFHILSRNTPPATPIAHPVSQGVLDILVDGLNLTARVGEGQTTPFLRDLALATVELATARKLRTSVRFYLRDEVWELGLIRDGQDVLLSVFRGGAMPEVAVHERRVPGKTLLEGVLAATEELLVGGLDASIADLEHARDSLAELVLTQGWGEAPALPSSLQVLVDASDLNEPGDCAIELGCEASFRLWGGNPRPGGAAVERADLHSLLTRGRMRIVVRDTTRDLGEVYPFLVAEKLVAIAVEALEAANTNTPWSRGVDGLGLGLRVSSTGQLEIVVGRPDARIEQGRLERGERGDTFAALDARSFATAVWGFGRALARVIVRHDRSQSWNLRYRAFRSELRALSLRLKSHDHVGAARINEAPESYRAFAQASQSMSANPAAAIDRFGHARMRFSPRWTGTVPGIDLRGTFLCGDRLIATGSRETACIDRATGTVMWRQPTARGIAVPTPGGLARVHADGLVQVLDFGTGETTMSIKLSPRRSGSPTGAVVHAPGLPRLLVVTDGERSLSAVDLVSGEIRWRHTMPHRGQCRVRRAGRLILEVSGGPSMAAIDVQTGDLVWRVADSRSFCLSPTVDHDDVFAIAGDPSLGPSCSARLIAVDAWSGQQRFNAEIPAGLCPWAPPITTSDSVAVVVESEQQLGLVVFDRQTGALRYKLAPGLAPLGSAWLAVDDTIVVNTEQGELFSIEAVSGRTVYRHLLSQVVTDDGVPRRLEPVLRSGALFVPQRDVFVVRPRDGEIIGQIQGEIIPDLLRVDERCDVYMAEESGHIAAFGAAAKLTRIK